VEHAEAETGVVALPTQFRGEMIAHGNGNVVAVGGQPEIVVADLRLGARIGDQVHQSRRASRIHAEPDPAADRPRVPESRLQGGHLIECIDAHTAPEHAARQRHFELGVCAAFGTGVVEGTAPEIARIV